MKRTIIILHESRHCQPLVRGYVLQKGITMVTVMVMLLLCGLLVLGGSRVSLINEKIVGNSLDYQRAFEAAEATLKDAALDTACLRAGCNNRIAVCNKPQLLDFQAAMALLNPPCLNGLCNDLGPLTNGDPATSFWSPNPAVNRMPAFNAVGASYGQYTTGLPAANTAINPALLANQTRYWIEIIPYGGGMGSGRSVSAEQSFTGGASGVSINSDSGCPVLFRVTAVATGLKPNTTAVVQSLYMFNAPPNE